MSVHPGKGGQKFIDETVNKIKKLKEHIENNHLENEIEVDGGIEPKTLKLTRDAGATIFVAGSYIFKNGSIEDQVMKLKKEDK